MGLTGGIVDVGGLADCLSGALLGKADADSILEKYHEIRSQKWRDIINPVSSANIVRLFKQDPETALAEDAFLKMCLENAKAGYKSDLPELGHDFMKYYGRGGEEIEAIEVKEMRREEVVRMPVAVGTD